MHLTVNLSRRHFINKNFPNLQAAVDTRHHRHVVGETFFVSLSLRKYELETHETSPCVHLFSSFHAFMLPLLCNWSVLFLYLWHVECHSKIKILMWKHEQVMADSSHFVRASLDTEYRFTLMKKCFKVFHLGILYGLPLLSAISLKSPSRRLDCSWGKIYDLINKFLMLATNWNYSHSQPPISVRPMELTFMFWEWRGYWWSLSLNNLSRFRSLNCFLWFIGLRIPCAMHTTCWTFVAK